MASKLKITLVLSVFWAVSPALAQDNMPEAISRGLQEKKTRVSLIKYEMTLAENEVAGYNKIIRQESRACERMKDKVRRLQYKAVRKTSDIDTTKERRMTYAEWQLRKAEQEEQQAATKVAKAEQSKQEKVLYLGQKVKELDEARLDLAVANSRSAHYPPLEPNNNLDLNIKESRKNKKLRHQKNLH